MMDVFTHSSAEGGTFLYANLKSQINIWMYEHDLVTSQLDFSMEEKEEMSFLSWWLKFFMEKPYQTQIKYFYIS